MDYKKKFDLVSDLQRLAVKNKIVIFSGSGEKFDELIKDFSGTHYFFTDGAPSKELVNRKMGEAMQYDSSHIITLQKPKISKEESIIEIINGVQKKFPHLRFGQILHSLHINTEPATDIFSTEDKDLMNRVTSSHLYLSYKMEKDAN